jgi:hypothetical protein
MNSWFQPSETDSSSHIENIKAVIAHIFGVACTKIFNMFMAVAASPSALRAVRSPARSFWRLLS